jgi:hypothetical protein
LNLLLCRRLLCEFNALLDLALEALDSGLHQGLLLVGDLAEGVDGLLDTVGLRYSLAEGGPSESLAVEKQLTPSSTGTEKKSTPTFSAISLPPGTPGR